MDNIEKRIMDSKNFPTMFHIEPTNICNQMCSTCYRYKPTISRPEGFMELETVKRLINEARLYLKQPNIEFYKDGEPLLHPKIVEMIQYATDKNCVSHISTNCILLRENLAEKLIKAGLKHLTMSALAINKEQNMKIKKCDNFDVMKENITKVKKIRDELGFKTPIIRIKTLSVFDTPDFHKIWKPYCDAIHVSFCHNWNTRSNSKNQYNHKNPCSYLWVNPAINWDGDVSLCCTDYLKQLIVGNIHNNSLFEIWNGLNMDNYRKKQFKNQIPVCSHCNQWDEIPNSMIETIKRW